MRYRLRTLLIVLALGPVILAVIYWRVEDYQRRQRANAQLRQIGLGLQGGSAVDPTFLPPGARWRNAPWPATKLEQLPPMTAEDSN